MPTLNARSVSKQKKSRKNNYLRDFFEVKYEFLSIHFTLEQPPGPLCFAIC